MKLTKDEKRIWIATYAAAFVGVCGPDTMMGDEERAASGAERADIVADLAIIGIRRWYHSDDYGPPPWPKIRKPRT